MPTAKSKSDLIREYTSDAPVDIEGLVDALGIKLKRSRRLHPMIAGQIERLSDGKFEISTNASNSYFRQRFTIAHELAHYLFHRNLIGKGVDDTKAYRSLDIGKFNNTRIKPEHETEANQIAAKLLMPAPLVRRYFHDLDGDLDDLAKKFQVSKEAMGYRAKALGLEIAAQPAFQ